MKCSKAKLNKKAKINRYVIVFLCSIFLLSNILVNGIFKEKNANETSVSSDDKKVASEISNVTGMKIDEVIKLKESGLNWNEILKKVKSNNSNNEENIKSMRTLLASNGVMDEFYEKLKNDGFKDEEITAAKMLVDRVIAELNEITSTNKDASTMAGISNSNPSEITKQNEDLFDNNNTKNNKLSSSNSKNINSNDINTDELKQYKEIQESFDNEKSVYLLLKLKLQLGSLEEVMDEYLCSIQIGIDLETCITDKKAYDEEKAEKLLGIDITKLITLAKIEAYVLQRMQNGTLKNNSTLTNNLGDQYKNTNGNGDPLKSDQTIKSPLPDVNSPRPVNPSKEIMAEINEINNRSLNMDGR